MTGPSSSAGPRAPEALRSLAGAVAATGEPLARLDVTFLTALLAATAAGRRSTVVVEHDRRGSVAGCAIAARPATAVRRALTTAGWRLLLPAPGRGAALRSLWALARVREAAVVALVPGRGDRGAAVLAHALAEVAEHDVAPVLAFAGPATGLLGRCGFGPSEPGWLRWS